ncbi:hypothetical protein ElyMa_006154500 [Elysia marginata]|uniref:Uncharacterized protein n=1 Tax=Elysia marginata TaxID=1093978 RepID=A0AAV4H002_9GAST|nr:hypothetical protein ElyMa_006154500 [Elysia marginata]
MVERLVGCLMFNVPVNFEVISETALGKIESVLTHCDVFASSFSSPDKRSPHPAALLASLACSKTLEYPAHKVPVSGDMPASRPSCHVTRARQAVLAEHLTAHADARTQGVSPAVTLTIT